MKSKATIIKVDRNTDTADRLLSFVENCSWTGVKDHIAEMIRSREFSDWETMFVALVDGKIAGMASALKTDYYPLPDIYPWVSCIFVSEEYRGQKFSGRLIEFANGYLKEKGFRRSYIASEFFGLYEQYGYDYLKDIVNYGGDVDHLFAKDL
ncbi:MAG: GNAT family N-acetyltransferase [Clostridia bacterium]|nr:GNAT family N-acetyltransferase [Clostridia bacterium]